MDSTSHVIYNVTKTYAIKTAWRQLTCDSRLSLPAEVRRRCNDRMWRNRRCRWSRLNGTTDARCRPSVAEILRWVSPLVASVQRNTLPEVEVPSLGTRLHQLFVQLPQHPDVLRCVRGRRSKQVPRRTRFASARFDSQYIHVTAECRDTRRTEIPGCSVPFWQRKPNSAFPWKITSTFTKFLCDYLLPSEFPYFSSVSQRPTTMRSNA